MTSINKWIESYQIKIKDNKLKWNKKREEGSIVNAVIIEGEIVLLDKNNVNKVDFSKADEVYYFDDDISKPMRGNFKFLAGTGDEVTEIMRIAATEEYKKIVKLGNKLTIDIIKEIRNKVNII